MFVLPFFRTAATSPARQRQFRIAVASHITAVGMILFWAGSNGSLAAQTIAADCLLVLGIVEGAAFIGWRLVQLPKNPALEFLLASPLQPVRIALAELQVNAIRFLFVQATGIPLFLLAIQFGAFDPDDPVALFVMPLFWGLTTGLLLVAWIYEPPLVRRLGEILGMFGVLLYLVIGLLAGERLRSWLELLPEGLATSAAQSIYALYEFNPFGFVRSWFAPDRSADVLWERFAILHGLAGLVSVLAAIRVSLRLSGHFHDRHYRPIDSRRPDQSDRIGDHPLSWWAVRRVLEYSGRINLWLAGGVALFYAAFIVAGDHWPVWMGTMVFKLFDSLGGAAAMATGLCVLATVPALFQYGLWDATVADRCRRLELLLLSELNSRDFARAAAMAAWVRGRGYLVAALLLWFALGWSGRNVWIDVLAAGMGSVVLGVLAFSLGFRSFATGRQTSGLASLFVLGLPVLMVALRQAGLTNIATLLPVSLPYAPLADGVTWPWIAGLFLAGSTGLLLLHHELQSCTADLQSWYDRNHGRKSE